MRTAKAAMQPIFCRPFPGATPKGAGKNAFSIVLQPSCSRSSSFSSSWKSDPVHVIVQDLAAQTADRCPRLTAQHFQLALRFLDHRLNGFIPFDGVSGSIAHLPADRY